MSSQAQTLKSSGLKVTLPRLKVLEMFEKSPGQHFSAEEVYNRLIEQGNDIGIATVYRILMQFADAGLLRKSNFDGDKAWFELDDGQHHDHLVCLDCGRVEEFFDPEIERRQQQVALSKGFELTDHALSLYAHCRREPCPHRKA